MAWSFLDDKLHLNKKIQGLSDKAFRFYICSITCSNLLKTGGFLSENDIKIIGLSQRFKTRSTSQTVLELIEKGFFLVADGGYEIHDWQVYNKGVSGSTERVRRFRERQKQEQDVTPNETLHETRHSNAFPSRAPVPLPSHKVNTNSSLGSNAGAGGNSNAEKGEAIAKKRISTTGTGVFWPDGREKTMEEIRLAHR